MHPYDTEYASNEFWAALALRVEPLIGDVEKTLGYYWMDEVEDHFSRWDWLAVQMARKHGRVHDGWYVLRWHRPGLDLGDDELVAGESVRDCLAHMAMRCTDGGKWPSAVSFDSPRTTFTLNGDPFAELWPAPPPQARDDDTLSRVESTVLGLQFHENQAQALGRRIGKWPGMRSVSGEAPDKATAHLPCPSEWLNAARHLWQKANKREATTAEAQQLAAAVFESPSWNHLCGLIAGRMNKDAWWSINGPFVVNDGNNDGAFSVHTSMADGFIEFARRAGDLAREEPCIVNFQRHSAGHPYLSCASMERP